MEKSMEDVWEKLKFTSGYHPQADPAERANRQVMEAFRAAVATVVQYDCNQVLARGQHSARRNPHTVHCTRSS